ncbi:MAG: helix-turn-helix domain-containing protein, partial [Pseudomonadota bacterium]
PPPMLGDDKIDILIIHGIERMHSGTQRRLARAIRDGAFRASASRTMQPVYPRIIFTYSVEATRSGGGHLGADGTVFSQEYDLNADLVEVLAGQHVRLPPLRDRIPDLIELIDVSARTALGHPLGREDFSVAAFKRLQAHLWPRNEDEMALMIGGLAGRAAIGAIQPEELKLLQDAETPEVVRVQSEKDRIVDALWRHGYRRGETAQALGMSRKTLYNKIQKFGLSG